MFFDNLHGLPLHILRFIQNENIWEIIFKSLWIIDMLSCMIIIWEKFSKLFFIRLPVSCFVQIPTRDTNWQVTSTNIYNNEWNMNEGMSPNTSAQIYT